MGGLYLTLFNRFQAQLLRSGARAPLERHCQESCQRLQTSHTPSGSIIDLITYLLTRSKSCDQVWVQMLMGLRGGGCGWREGAQSPAGRSDGCVSFVWVLAHASTTRARAFLLIIITPKTTRQQQHASINKLCLLPQIKALRGVSAPFWFN